MERKNKDEYGEQRLRSLYRSEGRGASSDMDAFEKSEVGVRVSCWDIEKRAFVQREEWVQTLSREYTCVFKKHPGFRSVRDLWGFVKEIRFDSRMEVVTEF